MQSLTLIIFTVSNKKCNINVFATYGQLADWPNTDHNIASHFSCKSKSEQLRQRKSVLVVRYLRMQMASSDTTTLTNRKKESHELSSFPQPFFFFFLVNGTTLQPH